MPVLPPVVLPSRGGAALSPTGSALHRDSLEAPRIDGRPGPFGAGPWPERPVSAANKSGNDHRAPRLPADQSALALRTTSRTLVAISGSLRSRLDASEASARVLRSSSEIGGPAT